MIGAPGEPGAASLRAAEPSEADAVQALWEASNWEDDPAGWFRGGWAIAGWATHARALVRDGRIVGAVGLRAEQAPDGAMPVRIALDLAARQPPLAALLVTGGVDLVREAGGALMRVFVSSQGAWLQTAARAEGFQAVRTVAHMLMPADAPSPTVAPAPGVNIRSVRPGEDAEVLAALNRAWAGTWNFVPISPEMLADDLRGQREGMLLAVNDVNDADRILATCHAVFDPSQPHPDGNPRAWISNLTVDPDCRQRGLARAMLAAGIAHLRSRGARSITLGVDADDPAPFGLYTSVGFGIASSLEAWDKALS